MYEALFILFFLLSIQTCFFDCQRLRKLEHFSTIYFSLAAFSLKKCLVFLFVCLVFYLHPEEQKEKIQLHAKFIATIFVCLCLAHSSILSLYLYHSPPPNSSPPLVFAVLLQCESRTQPLSQSGIERHRLTLTRATVFLFQPTALYSEVMVGGE